MKILQICNKPPYPPTDGGTLAMYNLAKGFVAEKHELKVFAIATQKHPYQPIVPPSHFENQTSLEAITINTAIKLGPFLKSFFKNTSYNIDRFYSSTIEKRLQDLLREQSYEVIILDSLFSCPYLPALRRDSSAKILLRAHNIEFDIWHEKYHHASIGLKKMVLGYLYKQIKQYELAVYNQVDGILAITQADKDKMRRHGCKQPIEVVPFGIDPLPISQQSYQPVNLTASSPKPHQLAFFHLGSMNWEPNMLAVNRLIYGIWPKLLSSHTGIQLHIAGRSMPPNLLKAQFEAIHIIGEVQDQFQFISQMDIMLVPLTIGSGVRVKIIEAMHMGKLVISTRLGAQGIDCEEYTDILFAETDQEFVNQMAWCIQNPKKVRQIGQNAKLLAHRHHNNLIIANKLSHFLQDLIIS